MRLAQGKRGRVPSDTRRRTCSLGSCVHCCSRSSVAWVCCCRKGADAELGREALGQLVLCLHGELEMVQPEFGHEQGMRQVQEGCQRQVGAPPVGLLGAGQHDGQRLGVVSRQMAAQGLCDVAAARHQRQGIEAAQGVAEKGVGVKARVHRCHHAGNGLGYVGAVLGDQWFTHVVGVRAGCAGASLCAAPEPGRAAASVRGKQA